MSAFDRKSVQRALALAFAATAAFAPARAFAQAPMLSASAPVAPVSGRAAVPYSVGEELTYRATFGGIRAGTARMRVEGVESIRGRQAYHVVFTIEGGVAGVRVHERYDCWMVVVSLCSLRFRQLIADG